MKQFLKYFFAAMIFQIIFLIVFVFVIPTAIGEIFAIIFYLTPWMLFLTETGEKKELSNLYLTIGIGIPAFIYSTILSLVILILKRILKKKSYN